MPGCCTLNRMLPIAVLLLAFTSQYNVAIPPAPASPFQQYPAPDAITSKLAMPKLIDAEERRYRQNLEGAITNGYGVVDGGTEHQRPGANFAGRYVLVQWGCGSNCMRAALIDGRDGTVLRLPSEPHDSSKKIVIPTGSVDMRTLEFRWNSTLLGIPHIADGMTWYYTLERGRWRFIRKQTTPPGHD